MRGDGCAERQVEQVVACCASGHLDVHGSETLRDECLVREDVDVEELSERVAIAEAYRLPDRTVDLEDGSDERVDLVHELEFIPPDSIPLQKRELGLMPAADLTVAKDAAYLIDVARFRRQQSLHRILGGGHEVQPLGSERSHSCAGGVELQFRGTGPGERWRLDLQNMAFRKERSNGCQNPCAQLQRLERSRGLPRGHWPPREFSPPSASPMCMLVPGVRSGRQVSRPGGSIAMTVEPRLN